jgi:hypothetical protein
LKASSDYDPDKYGQSFLKIDEGKHMFEVERMAEKKGKNGPYIEASLKCKTAEFKEAKPVKAWLFGEDSIGAIFDAMGINPATVEEGKDYNVRDFIGETVWAEIHHVPSKDNPERSFANVKRLYPYYSKHVSKGESMPEEATKPLEDDDVPW